MDTKSYQHFVELRNPKADTQAWFDDRRSTDHVRFDYGGRTYFGFSTAHERLAFVSKFPSTRVVTDEVEVSDLQRRLVSFDQQVSRLFRHANEVGGSRTKPPVVKKDDPTIDRLKAAREADRERARQWKKDTESEWEREPKPEVFPLVWPAVAVGVWLLAVVVYHWWLR
jgi:hypothetical protein